MEERKVVVGDEGKGAGGGEGGSQKHEAPETQGPRGLGVCFASLMAPGLHIKPCGAPGSAEVRSVSR